MSEQYIKAATLNLNSRSVRSFSGEEVPIEIGVKLDRGAFAAIFRPHGDNYMELTELDVPIEVIFERSGQGFEVVGAQVANFEDEPLAGYLESLCMTPVQSNETLTDLMSGVRSIVWCLSLTWRDANTLHSGDSVYVSSSNINRRILESDMDQIKMGKQPRIRAMKNLLNDISPGSGIDPSTAQVSAFMVNSDTIVPGRGFRGGSALATYCGNETRAISRVDFPATISASKNRELSSAEGDDEPENLELSG